SANFCFQSSVQISYASASDIGQIFRADQRLAAKARKHQAHQFSTRCLDRQARGECGSSVEVVDAPGFAIGLKQFVDRIAVRRVHLRKYAPPSTKAKVYSQPKQTFHFVQRFGRYSNFKSPD